MKYLFTYTYRGVKNGEEKSGNGSIVMVVEGTNKITESLIFGNGGSVDIAKKALEDDGFTGLSLAPMGWYKFDQEDADAQD